MAKFTAYRTVRSLSEHRQAFLNFYNRKSWVHEELNYNPANMIELVMAAINHGPMNRDEFFGYSALLRELFNSQNYYRTTDLLAVLLGYKGYKAVNKIWQTKTYIPPLLSIKEAIAIMQGINPEDYRHHWVKIKKRREYALFKVTTNRYAELQADIQRARQVRFGTEPIQWRCRVRRSEIEMILNERFPVFANSQLQDLKDRVLDAAFYATSRMLVRAKDIREKSQLMRRLGKQAKELEGSNYFPSLNGVYHVLVAIIGYPNYGDFVAYNDLNEIKDNKNRRSFLATHMSWLYNLNYRIYSVSWERISLAEYKTRMQNKEHKHDLQMP